MARIGGEGGGGGGGDWGNRRGTGEKYVVGGSHDHDRKEREKKEEKGTAIAVYLATSATLFIGNNSSFIIQMH